MEKETTAREVRENLTLFDVLQRADPALVDPGVTAQLELLLDDVVVGTQEMAGAVDAVCAQALRIIGRLTVGAGAQALPPTGDALSQSQTTRGGVTGTLPPTEAMKRYVVSLSQQKSIVPPAGYARSSAVCRAFLDQHAPSKGRAGGGAARPTAAWPAADGSTPQQSDTGGSGTVVADGQASSPPRSRNGRGPTGNTRKTRPTRRRTTPPPAVEDRPRTGSGAAARLGAGGTPLRIPFGNKEVARKLGAHYGVAGWYAPPGVALDPFRERGWV